MLNKHEYLNYEWINNQEQFESLLLDLHSVSEIALDTEFHRERTYFPKLALIQVGWADRIALIDPFSLNLRSLENLFQSGCTLVVHAATQDLDILFREVGALPSSLFDTQIAAGFIGFSNPSLAVLTERILGISLPKGDRLTDWTRRPLSDAQLRYAASDVANLLTLKEYIVDELKQMGRLEWALDESKVLLERDRSRSPLDRAWWKIKECRHLKGDSRKVAQCLAAWREKRASQLDVPVRFVLSDLAIAAISQDLPNNVSDLTKLRGVEQRFLAQGIDREILNIITIGREMPDSELSIPTIDEGDKRLKPIANLATLWVAHQAQKLKVDSLLLATRSDIMSFLGGDLDSRISFGWRNEVLGEPITKLANGELSLALTETGEVILEERSFRPYVKEQ